MPILKKRRKLAAPEKDENEEIEEIKQKLEENIPETGSHLSRSSSLSYPSLISSQPRINI
jgi:hypothetical protein